MVHTPKQIRQQRRRVHRILKRIDPGWSGRKPRFRPPTQICDAEGRILLLDLANLYDAAPHLCKLLREPGSFSDPSSTESIRDVLALMQGAKSASTTDQRQGPGQEDAAERP